MNIWNTEGQYKYKVEDLEVWEVGVVWHPYIDDDMTNCWRWFFEDEKDALLKKQHIKEYWKEPESGVFNHLWCQKIWVCKEPTLIKKRMGK